MGPNGHPFTIGIINASPDKSLGMHNNNDNPSYGDKDKDTVVGIDHTQQTHHFLRGTTYNSNHNNSSSNHPIQPMTSILAQKLLESLPDTIMHVPKTHDNNNVSVLSTTSSSFQHFPNNNNNHHHQQDQHSDTTLTNVLSSSELSSKASSNNDSSDHSTPFDTTDTSDEEQSSTVASSGNVMNNNHRRNNESGSSSLSSSMESNISYLPIDKSTHNDNAKVPNTKPLAVVINSSLSSHSNPGGISSVRNLIQSSNNTNNLLTSSNSNPVDPILSSLKRPRGSSNFVFSGSFDLTTSQGSFDLTSSSSTPNFLGNGLVSSPSTNVPFGNTLFSMNNNNNNNGNNGRSTSSLSSPSTVLSPLQSVLQHNLRQSGMQNTNPVVPSQASSTATTALMNPFATNRGLINTNNEDVATQMAAVVAGCILPGNTSSSSNAIPSASVAAISVATPESLSARIAANMNKSSSSSSLLRNKSSNRTQHSSSSSAHPSYHHNDPLSTLRNRGLSEDMLFLSTTNEFNSSLLNYSSSNNSAGAAPSIVTTLTELNHNYQHSLSRGASSNSILSNNSDNNRRNNHPSFISGSSSFPDHTFDQLNSSSFSTHNNLVSNSSRSSGTGLRSQNTSSSQRGSHPLSRTSSSSVVTKPPMIRPIIRDMWDEPFDQIDTMVDSINETNVIRNTEVDENNSISDSDDSTDSDLDYDDEGILKDIDDINADEDIDDALESNVRELPSSTIVSARQLSASPLNHITSYPYNRPNSTSTYNSTSNSKPPTSNTSSIRLIQSNDNISTPVSSSSSHKSNIDPNTNAGLPSSYPKKKGIIQTSAVVSGPTSNIGLVPITVTRGASPTVSTPVPKDSFILHDNPYIPSNATIVPIPINATTANRNLELENAGITLANGYGVLSCTETMIIDEIMLPVVPRIKTWVGAYPPAARYERLQRFLSKRNQRVWEKTVKYDVRKSFADSRLRVKGRFVKKEDEALLRDFMQLL